MNINADRFFLYKKALDHAWLKEADRMPRDAYQISTDRLKNYYGRYRDWYSNASCRTWYRRRPLSGAFTHPSCMVYPPGEMYTPRESPDREPRAVPDLQVMQNLLCRLSTLFIYGTYLIN